MKELGFSEIKIYNGGIKDWQKSGYTLDSTSPLPEYSVNFVDTDLLHAEMQNMEAVKCRDNKGKVLLTILDFRNANHISSEKTPPQIITSCPVQKLLLDDLLKDDIRMNIPRSHDIITITETGNRDEFAIRYLAKFGFPNLKALKFGMRGWLKQRYPIK